MPQPPTEPGPDSGPDNRAELAIDFGTSNTAAAVLVNGRPHIIPLEDGGETLPTAIFLDFSARRTLVGNAAIAALIDGREGRFMRALKSVLGTTLMREKRQFLNERLTLIEITARFLAQVKSQAEAHCGLTFTRALSGRPVRFHSTSTARDAQAERDLRDVYAAAGFASVRFLLEPEAAALASETGETAAAARSGRAPRTGLIVDIGGGTSDFTVFRKTVGGGTEIVASHGIRLGGTNFDRTLSLAHVMPLFGRGSGLKAELGDQVTPAPLALFNELATWATIPFLYTAAVRRDVGRMRRLSVEPEKFARLETVLEMELGHDVAFAVEDAKIAAGDADRPPAQIDLGLVEKGLGAALSTSALHAALSPAAAEIAQAGLTTVARAGLAPDAVDRLVFVGGSSLLATVTDAMGAAFPGAEMQYGKAFTAIVDGLALATARA